MVRIKTPRWYVITGAPSSGITALATALRLHVDKIFPETARVLIDRNLKKGIPVAETRADEATFQQKVLQMKLQREAKARKDKAYIFERGVPDSIPYFMLNGLDPKPVEAYSRNRYRRIFHLAPLAYERDYARTESDEARLKLSKLLLSTYKNLGYEVIGVPAVPVEERVKIVLPFL